jgi:molybdopterin/thiamine biosynthesis adenylyltransferase
MCTHPAGRMSPVPEEEMTTWGFQRTISLAVAGVGNIIICDFDSPDWSNLNGQILHDHTRIGTNKAISGKMMLKRLNPVPDG